jgi:hypothetical protein
MRKSLLSNFHKIWIDNLNGDKYRTGKLIPAGLPGGGSSDQSVFTTELDSRGIQPGTAIITLVKRAESKVAPTAANVRYRDFWGLAQDKRSQLIAALPTGVASSATPYITLKPTSESRWRLSPTMTEGGYEAWPGLDELFPTFYQGVEPSRGLNGTVIDTDRRLLAERIQGYFSAPSFGEATKLYPGFSKRFARYNPEKEWGAAKRRGYSEARIVNDLLFPFDQRHLYYEVGGKWLNESRPEFERNLKENEFFVTVPEPRKLSESRPVYSTTLVNRHVHERGSAIFPRETRGDDLLQDRDANISERTWRILRAHFVMAGERRGGEARALVGKLFRLGFAVLHAPAYQAEHKSALSADWAHLPIPKDRDLFARLIIAGEQVTRLLDADRDARDVIEVVLGQQRAAALGALKRADGGNLRLTDLKITISYWGGARGRWRPRPFTADEMPAETWGEEVWGARTGDLYINDDAFFSNVPEAVWGYQLGGYPVLKKWLGYRQMDRRDNEALTDSERKWFRQIVQRIAALLALGLELNLLYQAAATDAFTAAELRIDR